LFRIAPRHNGKTAKKETPVSRCKEGDLAFVIRDFDGCEGNLGKIVQVLGGAKKIPNLGTVWSIRPASTAIKRWWIVHRLRPGEFGKAGLLPIKCGILHPDEWLLPIRQNLVDGKTGSKAVDRGRKPLRESVKTPISA
jgi:hypothetical protein